MQKSLLKSWVFFENIKKINCGKKLPKKAPRISSKDRQMKGTTFIHAIF